MSLIPKFIEVYKFIVTEDSTELKDKIQLHERCVWISESTEENMQEGKNSGTKSVLCEIQI